MAQFQSNFKRVEKKYLLTHGQYTALTERLQGIAAVDAYGLTSILNIYYDTPDYHLIRTSLDKPVYKEKLRLRTYGVPDQDSPAFVEIKKKYKGVVYKRRISLAYADALHYMNDGMMIAEDSQIRSEIDYFMKAYRNLEPKMVISYDRIAMAGVSDPNLRITFDTNIRWRTADLDLAEGTSGELLLGGGNYLMEVKIAGALSLQLARIFSELKIHPASYSKYGSAYTVYAQRQQIRKRVTECAPQYHAAAAEISTGRTGVAYA